MPTQFQGEGEKINRISFFDLKKAWRVVYLQLSILLLPTALEKVKGPRLLISMTCIQPVKL